MSLSEKLRRRTTLWLVVAAEHVERHDR